METLVQPEVTVIARELRLPPNKIEKTIELLDAGNTIPFITRYRRDQTGGLDEQQILEIKQLLDKQRALAERKSTILKSIEAQGCLTEELSREIQGARSAKRLEDLYLPFKPKKQTLATIARQKGLEPLANDVLEGRFPGQELAVRATEFVRVDRGISSIEEVYEGVKHLLAEKFGENAEVRSKLRRLIWKTGKLATVGIQPEANSQPASAQAVAQTATEAAPVGVEATVAETPSDAGVAANPAAEAESPTAVATDATATDVTSVETATNSEGATDATSPEGAATESETAATVVTTSANMPAAGSDAKAAGKGGDKKKKKKKKKKNKEEETFASYFQFQESLTKLPPHRVLAINRGERAKAIRVRIEFEDATAFEEATKVLIREDHPHRDLLLGCVRDALTRLVVPSLEREVRRELTEKAETHAVQVFARNLRKLLLQPPVQSLRLVAIDPGFKTGCKISIINEFGMLLDSHVVFVVGNADRREKGKQWLCDAIRKHQANAIAIGNGTASREAEQLVIGLLENELKDLNLSYVIVNEAGASVYSTSGCGREELPDLDPTIRSAVSIGRRLQDPLSELVKISAENLGVGLYQHDVKAKHLKDSLDHVVSSCVNYVGVDANTASPALLGYVSGLNQLSARKFVEYRNEHGPFKTREDFRNVPGFGEATFVQAAGFLKINTGEKPLDATWIHPESYELANRILEKLGIAVEDYVPLIRAIAARNRKKNPPVQPPAQPAPAAPESTAAVTTPVDGEAAVSEVNLSTETATAPAVEPAPVVSTVAATIEEVNLAKFDDLISKIQKADHRVLAQELGSGELLVRDLLTILTRPGRDPRESLPPPVFRKGATKLEDLQPGTELSGRVLNVVDFGVFVDIGMSESGLIHISRLSSRYVSDPHQVVGVGETIRVWVVEVDKTRRRVSLTAINPNAKAKAEREPRGEGRRPRGERPARPAGVPGAPGATPEGSQPRDNRPRRPRRPEGAPAGARPEGAGPEGGQSDRPPNRGDRPNRGNRRPGGDPKKSDKPKVDPLALQLKVTKAEKIARQKYASMVKKKPATPNTPATETPAAEEKAGNLRSFSDLLNFYKDKKDKR